MDNFWLSFPDGSDKYPSSTQPSVYQERPGNEEGTCNIDMELRGPSATPSGQDPPTSLPPSRRFKKTASTKKLANFSVSEDLALVSCWLNVSTDPIVGTGQRRESYWKTIENAYNRNRGSFPERTQKSLTNRWDYIKEQVSKFAGYYQQVLHGNRSGCTDADKTAKALALFAELETRQFTVSHCWEVLKNEAKWIDLQEKRNNPVDGQPRDPSHVDGDPRDPTGHASNSFDTEADTASPTLSTGKRPGKRPMGRDAAKEARKRSSSTSGSGSQTEYVSRMHDMQIVKMDFLKADADIRQSRLGQLCAIEEQKMNKQEAHQKATLELDRQRIQLDTARLEMEQRIETARLQMEQKKEDERILAIDLESCNPAQRMYYKRMQEQILARLGSFP